MFIADLHNDLVQRMMIGEDVSKYTNVGHTDIPRLQESSIDMQIFDHLGFKQIKTIRLFCQSKQYV